MTWNTCAITTCGRQTRKPKGLLCRRCEDQTRSTPEKKAQRKEYDAQHYQANRPQYLERFKRYAAENRDSLHAKNAVYRANNRAILTAYVANWRELNPGYVPPKRLRSKELSQRARGVHRCQCSATYRCIEHSWLPQYMLEANVRGTIRIPLTNTRVRYRR